MILNSLKPKTKREKGAKNDETIIADQTSPTSPANSKAASTRIDP
jgi:hypothetical protein